jgi:hypothetical protein
MTPPKLFKNVKMPIGSMEYSVTPLYEFDKSIVGNEFVCPKLKKIAF